MWETIITLLIILAAAGFVGWRLYSSAKGKGGCSCGKSGGCRTKGASCHSSAQGSSGQL